MTFVNFTASSTCASVNVIYAPKPAPLCTSSSQLIPFFYSIDENCANSSQSFVVYVLQISCYLLLLLPTFARLEQHLFNRQKFSITLYPVRLHFFQFLPLFFQISPHQHLYLYPHLVAGVIRIASTKRQGSAIPTQT